jgi:uncharacterized membrane protein YdjX (TVP38/TMEM64 family)
MNRLKRFLPLLSIIALSLVVWFLGLHHYLSFDALRAHHEMIESYVSLYPKLSVGLYMAAYIAIVGLSIPGAAFMTLLGGLLFGQLIGTCSVVVSATIGATILFTSAKLASADFVNRKAGAWIDKMKTGFQENAFNYLLTLRLIPLFPFVAINLVAAVFQIPLRTFIGATFIGIIPGTFVFVSIGNALSDVILSSDITPKIILEPRLILALVGLAVLSLLPVIYKRFYKG